MTWDEELVSSQWDDPVTPWTDLPTEKLLEVELGYRSLSWLQDVDPYEFLEDDDILAMIPTWQPPSEVMEVS